MKNIKYIGYYTVPGEENTRGYHPAGVNKMDYIISVLNRSGYEVEIVSKSNATKFDRGSLRKIRDGVKLKQFTVIGNNNLIKKAANRALLDFAFTYYLWCNVKKGDIVLAYHSMGYANILRFLRKWRSFKLILEVEEIYSDVTENSRDRIKEMRLFHMADAYLFPTSLLNEKINLGHKPCAIVHGTYQVEPIRKNCKFEPDILRSKKHLVYAGTFDPRKGGAIAAAAAGFLPSDYHIHILGFGSERDTKILQDVINQVSKPGSATVTMDGLLSGEEYIRFIQNCDVGFSTQIPSAAFNNTSFPSKVLSYLANGLRVVSVRIPALEKSAVHDLLYYYDGDDPKAIVDAVLSIDWDAPYDSRNRISELDQIFLKEIEELLDGDT